MRITIFGDIMCEPPVLKGAKTKTGDYDFSYVFEKIRGITAGADYVIGNLEFPMAGEAVKYTDTYYIFNAPDAYAKAAREAGFDLISVVNNHTLDRGFDGLVRTLQVLDDAGLAHTGAFASKEEREEACYFEVGGVRFALVAYTYSTNKKLSREDPRNDCINYLRCPWSPTYTPEVSARMRNWVDKKFPKWKQEHRAALKKLLGMPPTIVRPDDYLDVETTKPYLDKLLADIKAAKEKADFVICYPHVGGQFNREPGKLSVYVMEQILAAGADAVFASHSHTVQKAFYHGKVPCAYCMGNFNMDASSPIVIKEALPDFGLAFHLDFEGSTLTGVTYSVTKSVWQKGKLVTWPVADLYRTLKTDAQRQQLEAEVREVCKVVSGVELTENIIRSDYPLQ